MTSIEQSLKGTETVRALRALGVKSLVVGLSANEMSEQFINAGADDFLLKPFPCKQVELQRPLMAILNSGPSSEDQGHSEMLVEKT